MGDSYNNWPGLLYPAEWGFRCFIAGALVWLIRHELHDPIAEIVFYALTVGVLGAFLVQVWVLIKFARRR